MRPLSRRTILLSVALILSIAVTLLFGLRTRRHLRRVRWDNEPVRAWMSVPFIAHTHHVPPDVLYGAIHVEPRPKDRRPVRQLARAKGRPVADMVRDLESAIAGAHKAP